MGCKMIDEAYALRIGKLGAERDAMLARLELLQAAASAKHGEIRAAYFAAGLDPDQHGVVTGDGHQWPFRTVVSIATGQPLEEPEAPKEVKPCRTNAPKSKRRSRR